MPPSDDPFGAGAGAFDPSEGIIESGGGDYKGKSNIGLTAFIFAVGVGVGIAGGWLGHTITSKSAQVDVGKTKGAQMVEGVQQISEGRKSVSLAMEGLTQKMGQDPKAAATEIESLLKDKFDLQQRIDGLFGWQLASVHKSGIDRTFQLYDEANRLKTDLGYLAAFLSTHAEALQAGGGPGNFAVLVKGDSAGTILAALEPLCGENPQNAQPCPPDKSGDAVAIRAIDSLAEGAEPKVFPLGNDPGQAVLLGKDGVYAYAVGMEPNKNAIVFRDSLLARINGHLEAMAKAEKAAMASLQNYADSPNVDGPAPEPPAE